jgi:hypothetical protein
MVWMMSRMAVSSPPGVSIRSTTSAAFPAPARAKARTR